MARLVFLFMAVFALLVPGTRAQSPEKELTDFTVAGMDRRFGPGYEDYHKGAAPEDIPEIWKPPTKEDVPGRKYEIAGPWTEKAGDFSSTQGQILYVPDDKTTIGMDRVTILEMTNNTYTESPQPPWHRGFRPEPSSESWPVKNGDSTAQPIAMARGMTNWSNCGVAIFPNGLVTTAGTATAKGGNPVLQLPADKIPTAISVTPKNEFALVTVFDAKKKKGQVAVIALGAGGVGFPHDWKETYPALCNVAVFKSMKLLGFVDLPGITYPTSICAVGSSVSNRFNGANGHAGRLRDADLSTQLWRDSFFKGSNHGFPNRYGFAVVAAKSEDKVAFIDLQPLFARVLEMYFTTPENYAKTRDFGPDERQWPYTFDIDPTWKPVVVQVIAQPTPVAVLASMHGGAKARAFVASVDGKISLFSVGGLATEGAASPGEIQPAGSVKVGRNPICLTYQKGFRDTIIVASRGDREIDWVKYSPTGAEVIRRLRDKRLVDPVNVEMADTHGTDTKIITVADFKGRKIINYRYDTIHFGTNGGARFGMGPDGKAEFECGGVMDFPGNPFCVSAANVN